MRPRTLVTQRLYFGVDPLKLREAGARVLARVAGLAAERAKVSTIEIQRDFDLDTVEGQSTVDAMVAQGLLTPRESSLGQYRLTERFHEYANARIVEPLSRRRARQLVGGARELASHINAEWTRNPLMVAAIAPFGCYISQDPSLDQLPIGVVVRTRPSTRRARWRMLSKAEGAREIRGAFTDLSSFVVVRLVTQVRELPPPFAVVFRAAEPE